MNEKVTWDLACREMDDVWSRCLGFKSQRTLARAPKWVVLVGNKVTMSKNSKQLLYIVFLNFVFLVSKQCILHDLLIRHFYWELCVPSPRLLSIDVDISWSRWSLDYQPWPWEILNHLFLIAFGHVCTTTLIGMELTQIITRVNNNSFTLMSHKISIFVWYYNHDTLR